MNPIDFQQFLKHCEQIQSLPDNRMSVRVKSTKQRLLLKKIMKKTMMNQELGYHQQIGQLEETLDRQKQLYHQNILGVIDYCNMMEYGDHIVIITQHATHTLEEQFKARRLNDSHFATEELENILMSLCKAIKYLCEADIGHGCLSLRDVLIDHNGTVKLLDPSMATNSPFNITSGYHYSPQLLLHNLFTVECSTTGEDIDFWMNDIFVLGLNILQLGLRDMNVADCYDYKQGTIDYDYLQDCLSQFQGVYQQFLASILSRMLQEDPRYRITPVDIIKQIEQSNMNESEQREEGEIENYVDVSNILSNVSRNKTIRSFLLDNDNTESSVSSQDSMLLGSEFDHKNTQNIHSSITNNNNRKLNNTNTTSNNQDTMANIINAPYPQPLLKSHNSKITSIRC